MGKLFMAILNCRLSTFIEVNNILNENQCGYRANYSTSDNIYAIIEYIRVRKLKHTAPLLTSKRRLIKITLSRYHR